MEANDYLIEYYKIDEVFRPSTTLIKTDQK